MTTTVTVRPDSTVAMVWDTLTGAATAHQANNDNSDASYCQTVPSGASESFSVGLADPTIPSGAHIISVTARARLRANPNAVADKPLKFRMVDVLAGLWYDEIVLPTTTITTFTGIARPLAPDGNPWDSTKLANMWMVVLSPSGTSTEFRCYELYLDVLYNEIPVGTVTAPTGSITTTTRPTITWTYSDPDADTQVRYQYKIFSAAQYGIGGFDPETSPNTYDSGEVISPAVSEALPIDLTNGTTYRTYLKVFDGLEWSAWDNEQFDINVSAPPAPNLVVTAQPTNADGPRVKVDITRTAHATPTTWMYIEYSDDAGATWAYLRDADHIVNSPDGTTFTIYDYESIPGVQRSYRAKAVRTV